MAVQPQEIHVGPANIYMGTEAPASGSPFTWAPHTAGVPATGDHVGATLGEAIFTWTAEKTEILAEQVMGVLDMFISNQGAELTFEAEERNFLLMQKTFDNIGSVDDTQRIGFYGGGGGTIIGINYTTIFLSSGRRDIPGAYEILFIYKAVSTAPMPLKYSRTGPSTYEVTFRCLPDTTRAAGDQIFQFSREKIGAAPATGATAGIPGTWTPPGSSAPLNLAAMASVTATPATAWTVGQYMILADTTEVHWSSTAWVVGRAT